MVATGVRKSTRWLRAHEYDAEGPRGEVSSQLMRDAGYGV